MLKRERLQRTEKSLFKGVRDEVGVASPEVSKRLSPEGKQKSTGKGKGGNKMAK